MLDILGISLICVCLPVHAAVHIQPWGQLDSFMCTLEGNSLLAWLRSAKATTYLVAIYNAVWARHQLDRSQELACKWLVVV